MKLASPRRADWPAWAAGAALAAGTAAVYARTFSVPLLLDDLAPIAKNPSIRRLWPPWTALAPPTGMGVGGRPLVNLSYAVNYAAGGTAVAGYHALNLLVHILAACVLFGLARRTFRLPALAERFGAAATPLALAVAAIWAWHPLQTESVTYISERAESLMGLFYLLTLYCFVRSVSCLEVERPVLRALPVRNADGGASAPETGRSTFFAVLAVGCCLLGMLTKEVMLTAPVLVLLYDRTFVSGSFAGAWRQRKALYVALAATWLPLALLLAGVGHQSVGFGEGVSPWAYALVESRAVVKYLLLCLWPHPLVFDYGIFRPLPIASAWPWMLALAALLAAAAVAILRAPAAGFAAAWFFLILAPTSSVVPVVGQPMAESRVYLPLAGVVALAVAGLYLLLRRRAGLFFVLVAAVCAAAAVRRNGDYRSAETIWADTVAKRPANARAHNNLGNAWLKAPGRLDGAIAEYQEALRLKPDYPEAHNNLGNAWVGLPGRLPDAIAQYEASLRLRPEDPDVHTDLGNALLRVPGRGRDAIAQFEEALRLDPASPQAHNSLGTAWAALPDRAADAIAQYQDALRLDPGYAEAHYNLGNAWAAAPDRLNEAIAEYEEALRLEPRFTEARYNLGNALAKEGRLSEAVTQYREALDLKPDYAEVHFNLAMALLSLPGRAGEARTQLEAFLRLQPDNVTARRILEQIPE